MEILPSSLRLAAIGTSATSAAAAYPIASEMFGPIAGGVIVFSCATVIFAGWHVVGNPSERDASDPDAKTKDIAKRALGAVIAASFATAMVAGIHASASQPELSIKADSATASDVLYRQQEGSRISTLGKLTEELRVTSKRNNPDEYARLQDQIERMSTPTPRQKTSSEQVPGTASSIYSWAIASAFEIVTPALLLLAGMFSKRRLPALTTAAGAVAKPVDAVASAVAANQQVIDSIELTQLPKQLPPSTGVSGVRVTADDIQEALSARQVGVNADDNVTAAAIEQHTGCTSRQARTAIANAVSNGYLTKTGSGGSTRYSYSLPANIRRIK